MCTNTKKSICSTGHFEVINILNHHIAPSKALQSSLEHISQTIIFSSFKSASKAHVCLLPIKSSVQAGPSTFLAMFVLHITSETSSLAGDLNIQNPGTHPETWRLDIFIELYNSVGLSLPICLYIFPH